MRTTRRGAARPTQRSLRSSTPRVTGPRAVAHLRPAAQPLPEPGRNQSSIGPEMPGGTPERQERQGGRKAPSAQQSNQHHPEEQTSCLRGTVRLWKGLYGQVTSLACVTRRPLISPLLSNSAQDLTKPRIYPSGGFKAAILPSGSGSVSISSRGDGQDHPGVVVPHACKQVLFARCSQAVRARWHPGDLQGVRNGTFFLSCIEGI